MSTTLRRLHAAAVLAQLGDTPGVVALNLTLAGVSGEPSDPALHPLARWLRRRLRWARLVLVGVDDVVVWDRRNRRVDVRLPRPVRAFVGRMADGDFAELVAAVQGPSWLDLEAAY